MEEILASLNEQQRAAVSAPVAEHYLILAGAGSGKTRVLVHRIAWLIQKAGVSPHGILAVTFTNKAAAEMRGRLETLLNMPVRGMWVGTFHHLAHRLLRMHWQEAGLPENFQILDAEDQYRLVRRVLKSLDIDEAQWAPRNVQWFINGCKDQGLRPGQLDNHDDVYNKTMQKIYQAYEEACQRSGLVDFAELLLRAHELWLQNPRILQHYQQRFSHLLIDEFQDTNTIQYAWIKLLAGDTAAVMSVGDDDQSIYGWRGAKLENIHRFAKEFPGTKTIRLEQNYRSTSTILSAANALINHNENRLGKELWTDGNEGDPIALYAAFNELDEARFIAGKIAEQVPVLNINYQNIAILYRSNAQSRVLEEALIQAGIPYRIYGGLRFFERAEIKDTLGYLRLIANRHDDTAFERIVNFPTRGIGDKTLETLRQFAREEDCSLWRAADSVIEKQLLSTRALTALKDFLQLITQLEEQTSELPLHEQTEQVILSSGLWEHFSKSRDQKARTRLENLEELITATKQFYTSASSENVLAEFLTHAALEAGEMQGDKFQNCVQLMTLHSAKGLEFPMVFLSGVEEGVFPNHLYIENPRHLEEERRLCYVGITRAMQKLFITYAQVRRVRGKEHHHTPSRFIKEIPANLLKPIRMKTFISRAASPTYTNNVSAVSRGAVADTNFKLGQRVCHAKFGEGVIVNYSGKGDRAQLQVNFSEHGTKWLSLQYAKLEAV